MTTSAEPSKSLLRLAGKAIADYNMIRPSDRILVGLSGGKDSLSLLHLLLRLQRRAPVRFEVGAVTVDPQAEVYDPSRLIPYMAELGVPYFYERKAILRIATKHMHNDSYCAFCSRMKRGVMYGAARREGYNVLALGQHLDDLAESFLLSAFYGGRLKTMKAHYRIDAGDLRVIRPLVYVRERQTAAFAHAADLPIIPENCPACFDSPKQRMQMKSLLAAQEQANPRLFKCVLSALRSLMAVGLENTQDAAPEARLAIVGQ
jgi:tRNA 2-thiocytidine biosynthesis protein TtcA